MQDLFFLAAGGLLLYLGAEWFVGGAAALALALTVPKLVVGLTVVAYGTSAPELVVGMGAAATGHGQIALANVIGSNIANLGLILGVAALIRPPRIAGALRARELPALALTTLVLPALLWNGTVSALEGAFLVILAVAYTVVMFRGSRDPKSQEQATLDTIEKSQDAALAGAPAIAGKAREVAITVGGLAMLLLGGKLFVEAATSLALAWGMSERVVGLTIVAVGTSLPELAASAIAAVRGHSDLAVGNVIGSNIFNVLLCLGGAALVGTVSESLSTVRFDLAVLGLITAMGLLFMRKERELSRLEGGLLLAVYGSFIGWLVIA